MELLAAVELATTAVTFLLFASGIPGCVHMVRSGNTRNVPYVFFLVSVINSSLALYYGVVVNNSTFIFINAVGLLLWGVYSLLFIAVSKSKSKPLSQLAAALLTLLGHAAYVTLVTPAPPSLTHTLGVFLFGWTVVLCVTPLVEIADIVKQGTSAGSDMFILLGSSVCGLSWLVYGYLLEDFFVYGPNILGTAINGAKVAAIVAYRQPLQDKKMQ